MSDQILPHNEKVCLGLLGVNDANRLKSRLAEKDITIALLFNHATCSSGCRGGGTVELWANKADLDEIVKTFQEERMRSLDGLNVNFDLLNQVYDPTQENAVCPACGMSFSTKLSECPECGLAFSIPEPEPEGGGPTS